jgi:hypothetical protein
MAALMDKGITPNRLSISIGYKAMGELLNRDDINRQVDYLRGRGKEPRNTSPLSPSQILGFDYGTIAGIK